MPIAIKHRYSLAHTALSLLQASSKEIDPPGPPIFALTINEIVRSCTSPLNVWCLDDGMIGVDLDSVCGNFKKIIPALSTLGPHVNPGKCDATLLSYSDDQQSETIKNLEQLLPGIHIAPALKLILGSPISANHIPEVIKIKWGGNLNYYWREHGISISTSSLCF